MSYGYNEYRLQQINQQLTPTLRQKEPTVYKQLETEKQQLLEEMLQDTHYTKDWKQQLIDKGGTE